MSNRPEPVLPLTPDQVAAILASMPGEGGGPCTEPRTEPRPEAGALPRSPWIPPLAGDPAFEARSRRDTVLANELLNRLREVRGILAAAPLPTSEAERAHDAMERFEDALMEMLRYHGT
jgi:hypothetical protein